MALSVRDREAETIAREMARRRGVTITQIVSEALREKGRNDPQAGSGRGLVSEMMAIARRCGRRTRFWDTTGTAVSRTTLHKRERTW